MGRFEYKITELSEHITQLTDATGVFLFLVQGTDKAVLIDTGVGFSSLRETVEKLTRLPVSVILTHAHGDHAGGVAAFDEVYLHPADKALLKEQGMDMRMEYAAACMPPKTELSKEDFIPECVPDKEILSLSDGQEFQLGGITLKMIHVPGHTEGSCCVLFQEERSILFGDACNANTLLLWGGSISGYKKSLAYLGTYREGFDKVYYSHGPAAEGPACSLEDNLELCDRIMAGTDDAVACEFMGIAAFRAAQITPSYSRLDGKYGNIVYSEAVRKG